MPDLFKFLRPKALVVDATWDRDAAVWIAMSSDVKGLVVEADRYETMTGEVQCLAPHLINAAQKAAKQSVKIRTEQSFVLG